MAEQTGVFAFRIGQMEFACGWKIAPHGLLRDPLQHGEHRVILAKNAAYGGGAVNAQGLEFAQQ